MATRPVLVGVDGSEESLRAVEWAARQAQRHGSPLRIVSAPAVLPRVHTQVDLLTVANALRGMSAQALAAALTRTEEVAPGLPVDTGLLSGSPAVALAAAVAVSASIRWRRLTRGPRVPHRGTSGPLATAWAGKAGNGERAGRAPSW